MKFEEIVQYIEENSEEHIEKSVEENKLKLGEVRNGTSNH